MAKSRRDLFAGPANPVVVSDQNLFSAFMPLLRMWLAVCCSFVCKDNSLILVLHVRRWLESHAREFRTLRRIAFWASARPTVARVPSERSPNYVSSVLSYTFLAFDPGADFIMRTQLLPDATGFPACHPL